MHKQLTSYKNIIEHLRMWVENNDSPCLGSVPVIKGKFKKCLRMLSALLPNGLVEICKPTGVYICDGSKEEKQELTEKLIELGSLHKLPPYENNYITCTDPKDVARVESKTWICSEHKKDTVPDVAPGVHGVLGQWISPDDLNTEIHDRYPNCMEGRVLYVIPFSMGPIGSPLSKVGIELTDSIYVVLCMTIMTRMHPKVWNVIESSKEFVRCVHSVGCPTSSNLKNNWPCNPEKTLISHVPKERLIMSFGSGYGKKCFALRIAGCIARDEGWLAEHMLIMSVTNPKGEEKFIAAAFPSACGKTNMAMLEPSVPGWKVQCVGDDIAWMRFDEHGVLRAINPEAGFFGVAPGTNKKTNPNAMATCMKNTIFTNIGQTKDGHIFWEGLEDQYSPDTEIITWLGDHVKLSDKSKDPKAHPNSRFCCPANQCPIIHPKWEDPQGVPISALIFGGRRPSGIPLVMQSFDWKHGVMLGAALKSEATAAAEFTGKNFTVRIPR
ncbi:Phosphoenolpyruvate carboxykinase [GTP] [Schistosoma japonicum]|nr:Phosphoenolpyruvate carboxykinase [GTP] [Schistosoma japonicum]